MVHRRRQGDSARAEYGAFGEAGVALGEVQPRLADVAPGLRGFGDDDPRAVRAVDRRVLLDRDGVRARRQRRAGEDAHRLARPDRAVEPGAGGGDADPAQDRRRGGDVA